jgi:hypothetical protein
MTSGYEAYYRFCTARGRYAVNVLLISPTVSTQTRT